MRSLVLPAVISIFIATSTGKVGPHNGNAEFDVVIANAFIVDGSGTPGFIGDVAIRGDRIAKIGNLGAESATKRIDASGLENAIRKMTSCAEERVHLSERGQLKPGYFADITVFDPKQIRDMATYTRPNQLSQGIQYVMVNGALVIDSGKLTTNRPGRPLYGRGYVPPSQGNLLR